MSQTGERVLWGTGTSRVFRAHWALIELDLPYRNEPLRTRTPDMDRPEFTALGSGKKIPVLQDGELTIAESSAIVTYLGDRYGQLLPTDIAQRARYYEWQSFISMELDATSLYVLRRHFDLTQIYGESEVANKASSEYFSRMINVASARYAKQRPGQPGPLLDQFSGVDILMMSCLDWAIRYKQPVPENLRNYRQWLADRDGYGQAVAANTVSTA